MAVPVHMLRGPGLLMSLMAVPVAVLVPLNMHVPGLLMHPLLVPLAMVIPVGMHVPGARGVPARRASRADAATGGDAIPRCDDGG